MKDDFWEWEDVVFQLGPKNFVCANERRILTYAVAAAEAENVAKEFTEKYGTPPKPCGGSFELIYVSDREIGTVTVQLEASTTLTLAQLEMYYGAAFAHWHGTFEEDLRNAASCLSIFEGAPGARCSDCPQ